MTTAQLLDIIGPEIESRILSGNFGDASLHKHGYIVGDPCYWNLPKDTEAAMDSAELAACPQRWTLPPQCWVEFKWQDQRCFFRACGDGVGPLGHCVDSGEVAAVPVEFVSAWETLIAL
jgi:hypothetical protein